MSGDFETPRMIDQFLCRRTRRHFFADCGVGLGAMALASLARGQAAAGPADERDGDSPRPHDVTRSRQRP